MEKIPLQLLGPILVVFAILVGCGMLLVRNLIQEEKELKRKIEKLKP